MQLAGLRAHHWVIGYLPNHRLIEYDKSSFQKIHIRVQSANVSDRGAAFVEVESVDGFVDNVVLFSIATNSPNG
jgi:hypothetical protein